MKTRTLLAGNLLVLLLLAAGPSRAADSMTTYSAKKGGKMRIEGTSNIHDWQVESGIVGGTLNVGPGFPTEPGQVAQPGKVEAKAEVFVPVMSLKSLEKSGAPYSDAMDNVMYDHLKSADNARIIYRLKELVLKEAAKDNSSPNVFDSTGDLTVAGVTKSVSMPVNVWPLADKRLKITGTTTLKMTDFNVEPPSPKGLSLLIRTGDEVKIIFEWMLAQKTPVASAGK